MTELIRIEAVNLRHTIDDTENLSTRRGGGYMLLEAIRGVEKKFADSLEPISTGASIGLFAVKSGKDREATRTAVSRYLREGGQREWQHATFVIDAVANDDFRVGVEQAVSKNRWQQIQTLSFANKWGDSGEICEIDQVRPAASLRKDKEKATSLSVDARSRAGRGLRQGFYARELGEKTHLDFTDDTESLGSFDSAQEAYASIPANLNGKMAVFYADGNGFGAIQRDCLKPEALRQWDTYLKDRRRRLLGELLGWLSNLPSAKTEDGELRFETLLWGGDEMLFLLPAWLGLEFAQKFFAFTADWNYGGKPLKHAAGLVMAKHSAPISQLQKLAKKLAENGKADKKINSLSWIVLESFDHAGDEMDDYWQRAGIAADGWQKLLLTPEKIAALRAVAPLKDLLPRSAMVRVLRSLAAGKGEEELPLLQNSYESAHAAVDDAQRADLEALWQAFGLTWQRKPETVPADDAIAWTALLELWDYLTPDAAKLADLAKEGE